jgi:hypothetical protein
MEQNVYANLEVEVSRSKYFPNISKNHNRSVSDPTALVQLNMTPKSRYK